MSAVVLGDVGHPEPVWGVCGEAAANEIERVALRKPCPAGEPAFGQALNPEATHDQLDLVVPDRDGAPVAKLSGDALSAIGA